MDKDITDTNLTPPNDAPETMTTLEPVSVAGISPWPFIVTFLLACYVFRK